MPDGQHHASSHRFARLVPKLAEKAYRNSYVVHQTRQFLARQVRALRGDKSQKEFGELLDKPQSVVSRLEDPNYGKWTLQTLFDVAASLDRAVIVRIVDYPTFLRFTSDMTDVAACPESYDQEGVDSLAHRATVGMAMSEAMTRYFSQLPYKRLQSIFSAYHLKTADYSKSRALSSGVQTQPMQIDSIIASIQPKGHAVSPSYENYLY